MPPGLEPAERLSVASVAEARVRAAVEILEAAYLSPAIIEVILQESVRIALPKSRHEPRHEPWDLWPSTQARDRFERAMPPPEKWTWLVVFQTHLQPVISSVSHVVIGTKAADDTTRRLVLIPTAGVNLAP